MKGEELKRALKAEHRRLYAKRDRLKLEISRKTSELFATHTELSELGADPWAATDD